MSPAPRLLPLLLSLVACASRAPLGDIAPGQRPDLLSDEAGLWMQMDRLEESLRTSGRLLRDPVVNSYVRALVCTLAGEHCDDIRVYVVETPHFNASMRPNGVMEVWTGLLLRAQNEAQLAYVLAHEIAHFKRRHSLQQWRDLRAKSDALIWFQIAASAAGHGYMGDIAQFALLANMMAFSRDQEREADELGFEMMADLGYDPIEASRIWEALEAEMEAGDEETPPVFFSSHPRSDERAETLRQLAEQVRRPETAGATMQERYLGVLGRVLDRTLRDELRLRQFERTQLVFTRLLEAGIRRSTVEYYRGELYRTRREEGDLDRAIEHYESAIALGDEPPEVHRALGLIHRERGEAAPARAALERYLERAPEAADRLMIEAYLRRLR